MNSKEENLSHDEQRVAELIGTLKRVDAPGDFDTRVRARIADGRNERPRLFWRPVLAAVTVTVLTFVGYLGLRSLNTHDAGAPTQEVANTKTTAPAAAASNQQSVSVPTPTPTQENAPSIATTKPPNVNNNAPSTRNGMDSRVDALRQPTFLTPKTLDQPQRRLGDVNTVTGDVPVTMVLQAIGVHATWNGGWLVDSVQPNGVGFHSGVRTGDVVEALNGQPIGEKTAFKGSFSGKSIRVRRDGASLDLAFKP
jgi:hypothetical protein